MPVGEGNLPSSAFAASVSHAETIGAQSKSPTRSTATPRMYRPPPTPSSSVWLDENAS